MYCGKLRIPMNSSLNKRFKRLSISFQMEHLFFSSLDFNVYTAMEVMVEKGTIFLKKATIKQNETTSDLFLRKKSV